MIQKAVQSATSYFGPNGVARGRPPLRGTAKRQVTLRLDPDVIEKFREGGPDWQVRMNEALWEAAGLA
ncbi:BrnA antitoxin family protein [Sphingomonas sp. NBWT7]|uniref:BrnA antitoxin family protein n=1 Tax=Sphingomonas sp. NBWT7 TaxID=2596913 RepID=UPI0021560482|nr:BrnA antitoxin family protein [Sphingomonas sp. NBWT7]